MILRWVNDTSKRSLRLLQAQSAELAATPDPREGAGPLRCLHGGRRDLGPRLGYLDKAKDAARRQLGNTETITITKQTMSHAMLCALLGVAVVGCAAAGTRKPAGEGVDDSVITGRVKSALVDDPTTKARQIEVQTRRGRVQLNGFVDSSASKARAAELAGWVRGVRRVDNNL